MPALLLAEIIGGIAGIIAGYVFPLPLSIFMLALWVLLLMCLITDWLFLRLYLPLIFLIAVLGGFSVYDAGIFGRAVIASVIGWLFFFALEKIYPLLTQKKGLGCGDKWLVAALGLWGEPVSLLYLVNYGAILGLAHALFLTLAGQMHKDKPLPFGSYLCASAILFVPLHLSKLAII